MSRPPSDDAAQEREPGAGSPDGGYRTRVRELRNQADDLDDGMMLKAELLEEAIRIADSHSDVDLAYLVRLELIRTAAFGGHPEKELVAFAWCLAQSDRDPVRFPERDLLWQFKWVMGNLHQFPQISRDRIEAMYADMNRRYERCGAAIRPILGLRWHTADALGDDEAAAEFYRKWESSPRGWPADCSACEQSDRVRRAKDLDDHERAIRYARPLLDGMLRCATIPATTFAAVLSPMLRLGQLDEAADCHRRGYRQVASNRKYLGSVSEHIWYLMVTENLGRAASLLERHLPWALETHSPSGRFWFLRTAAQALRRIIASGRRKTFRTPTTLNTSGPALSGSRPLPSDGQGRTALAELLTWCDDELDRLARLFNARNGNDRFSRHVESGKEPQPSWPYPLGRKSESAGPEANSERDARSQPEWESEGQG